MIMRLHCKRFNVGQHALLTRSKPFKLEAIRWTGDWKLLEFWNRLARIRDYILAVICWPRFSVLTFVDLLIVNSACRPTRSMVTLSFTNGAGR